MAVGLTLLRRNIRIEINDREENEYFVVRNEIDCKQMRRKRWSMKEFFQRVKASMILSAVVCVAIGVVLLIWPKETIDVFCKVLAAGLIIMGIVNLLSYFMNRAVQAFSGILGLVVMLVGFWVFIKPERVEGIIPIVIGAILAIHAIQDIKLAIETKRNGYEKWWSMLIIAFISLIFGVICIVNAIGVVKLAIQVVGIALIYDGVSDLWVVTKAVRMEKAARQEAEALDVEYKEVDNDTEE